MTAVSFDPSRFLEAQDIVMGAVHRELSDGRKQTHWMWYVFPQLAGLGHSFMARRFALHSLDEARAYLAHPVLGPRLKTCVELVLPHAKEGASRVFGGPDDMKFRSCMTLFATAAPDEPLFAEALDLFFDGQSDPRTLELLEAA